MIRRKRAKLARTPSAMARSLERYLRWRATLPTQATTVSGAAEVMDSTPAWYSSRKGARPTKSAMTEARGLARQSAVSVSTAWVW